MPIKRKRIYLNTWLSAGKHIHQAPGDSYQMTGLYPTLDRQELKRAPAFSSHLTHAAIDTVEGMFFDQANTRYVLIGQDSSNQLACTYFNSAWTYAAAAYVLDAAVPTMDGLSMRNYLYGPEYLWILCDDDVQRTANYVTTPLATWDGQDADLIARLADRIYVADNDTGNLFRTLTDASALETHFDMVWNMEYLLLAGLKDDLLAVGRHWDGTLHVYRTVAYAKTAIRKLEDMAMLPCDTGEYPSTGCPFAIHDNDLYLLSGSMPNPDGTETRDLLAYTGYRVERIARLDSINAAALAIGLMTWRGELIYYELAAASATFKMLVGNAFIDFAEVSSYSASGLAPVTANLGGNIVVVGKSGSDEGIYHAGDSILEDGNLETSWMDGGLPGVKKRLINVSLHVKDPAATTTKRIKYMVDDGTSYAQIANATSIAEKLEATSQGIEFYRLRLQAAIEDTDATQDVRIAGLSYTYAVGEE